MRTPATHHPHWADDKKQGAPRAASCSTARPGKLTCTGTARAYAARVTTDKFELGYLEQDGHYLYRFDGRGNLTDADGTDYGFVQASIMVSLVGCGWPEQRIEEFGKSIANLVAYPYLREAVTNTALRLGFTGVNLPLIEAGVTPPG